MWLSLTIYKCEFVFAFSIYIVRMCLFCVYIFICASVSVRVYLSVRLYLCVYIYLCLTLCLYIYLLVSLFFVYVPMCVHTANIFLGYADVSMLISTGKSLCVSV